MHRHRSLATLQCSLMAVGRTERSFVVFCDCQSCSCWGCFAALNLSSGSTLCLVQSVPSLVWCLGCCVHEAVCLAGLSRLAACSAPNRIEPLPGCCCFGVLAKHGKLCCHCLHMMALLCNQTSTACVRRMTYGTWGLCSG